ncbi:MAG: tryptophan synthase subunit alpha [Conexivisphaerales archaeon]
MSSRISDAFESERRRRGLLIAYTMGCYPSKEASYRISESLIDAGSDILELGIPFSDPIADGPSIQRASSHALSAGARPLDVLQIAGKLRNSYDTPIITMTYYNILYSTGIERFIMKAKGYGVDGMIIPDLLFEEAEDTLRLARKYGLDIILLGSPVTGRERLRRIALKSSGFLYLISLLGVTGAREKLPSYINHFIGLAKSVADGLPVAVGFGVSRPEQVRQLVMSGADGVVVGSAIIDRINVNEEANESNLEDLQDFIKTLKSESFRNQ